MTEDQINALPECIRQHARDSVALDKELGIDLPPAEVTESLAWHRWAGTLTNEELGDFIMAIRGLFMRGDNKSSVRLEEVAVRLKRHCNYKPGRTTSERLNKALANLKLKGPIR